MAQSNKAHIPETNINFNLSLSLSLPPSAQIWGACCGYRRSGQRPSRRHGADPAPAVRAAAALTSSGLGGGRAASGPGEWRGLPATTGVGNSNGLGGPRWAQLFFYLINRGGHQNRL